MSIQTTSMYTIEGRISYHSSDSGTDVCSREVLIRPTFDMSTVSIKTRDEVMDLCQRIMNCWDELERGEPKPDPCEGPGPIMPRSAEEVAEKAGFLHSGQRYYIIGRPDHGRGAAIVRVISAHPEVIDDHLERLRDQEPHSTFTVARDI